MPLNSGTFGCAGLSLGADFLNEGMNGSVRDPPEQDQEVHVRAEVLAGKVYHPEHKIQPRQIRIREFRCSRTRIPGGPQLTGAGRRTECQRVPKAGQPLRVAARSEEARKFKVAIVNDELRALAEEFARSRARNAERLLLNPV